ncbi:DUF91 domain-containing protein [Microbacterium sp. 4R-513]|uniref:DUF5655 domain-containing protein n=1 Tax=Microbacterium sp. 4R-513 TaxID=2567934 RepID=UPI0013E1C858|nr:DUF5655 domain-containing protein [Microbacterium sp. 4R-513]QIG40060.1 DUF91 domain-containing protein [Microbacterium sp. 4R-513]
MADLKLFRVTAGVATELHSMTVALERSLQQLIERNMEEMFATRFLASEFSTGSRHGGRIDSLGIDENNSPVIFEYKRATNENVINQGLFYLNWLLDHKAEFTLLVMEKLGRDVAGAIDWRAPRLVCVASGYTRYDEHAVEQINRSIDLVTYRDFGGELFALELVHASRVEPQSANDAPDVSRGHGRTVTELLGQSSAELTALYEQLDAYLVALGDDVSKKATKQYFAYRRLKNFACVEVHPQSRNLLVYLKVNPDDVELEEGFSRDVRNIGHFGTGELELRISNQRHLDRAQHLLQASYENS